MSRRRDLNEGERALWARVTRDISPVRKEPGQPDEVPTRGPICEPARQPGDPDMRRDLENDILTRPAAAAHRPVPVSGTVPVTLAGPLRGGKTPNPSRVPASPAFGAGDPGLDRRLVRKGKGGRAAVDFVLDLHGMTEAVARALFERTIKRAAADGFQCVLVITGKGGPASASAMAQRRRGGEPWRTHDDPYAAPWSDSRPGVLRRRFFDWVDAEAIRPLISRVSQARPRDGGTGAFYVIIKSKA